jgi:hypothetical protein
MVRKGEAMIGDTARNSCAAEPGLVLTGVEVGDILREKLE